MGALKSRVWRITIVKRPHDAKPFTFFLPYHCHWIFGVVVAVEIVVAG